MVDKVDKLADKFKDLKEAAVKKGCSEEEVIRFFSKEVRKLELKKKSSFGSFKVLFGLFIVPLFLATFGYYFLYDIFDTTSPCSVDNSIFVLEAARPVADCKMCKGLREVPKLSGLTSQEFVEKFAYTGRPLVVTDATESWSAMHEFSYEYFKKLYTNSEAALNSTEEDCQFFPYQTEFHSLRQVFKMSKARSQFKAEPWYVGWSNCDSEVRQELRRHYSKPYFIPSDSEHSETDWIFMGGVGPGANIHLDNVERPSWQAQLSGRKTWSLYPPPECESVCKRMLNVTIEKGEIVVIDTNNWYHATTVEPGEISITIGSEYD